MEKQQRTRVVTALILVLVFGTGFVVGMAFDRTATASPVADAGPAATPAPDEAPEEEPDDREERRTPMYEQVGELTPDQHARIDEIIDAFRAGGREIRDEWQDEYDRRYQPRVDSLVVETRERIKGVMTQEQAQRYDSLVADYEKRRDERRREHDSGDARRN